MRKLLLGIVALIVVASLVAVALGLIRQPVPDLNGRTQDAVGYVDVSAEIPIMKSQQSCGATTTTTGTWPFQTTTTSYSCDVTNGAFAPEVDEHLTMPTAPTTVAAQFGGLSVVSSTVKVKVLIRATDQTGHSLAEGWSQEKSIELNGGGILQFAWGHLYIDEADQWITLEFEIWAQGTDRYPTYEKVATTESSFFFDGFNA